MISSAVLVKICFILIHFRFSTDYKLVDINIFPAKLFPDGIRNIAQHLITGFMPLCVVQFVQSVNINVDTISWLWQYRRPKKPLSLHDRTHMKVTVSF